MPDPRPLREPPWARTASSEVPTWDVSGAERLAELCVDKLLANPNFKSGEQAAREMARTEVARRTQQAQDFVAIAARWVAKDGGSLKVQYFDISTGRLGLELDGSCASCGFSEKTLKANLQKAAKDSMPWFNELNGQRAALDANDVAAVQASRDAGRGGYEFDRSLGISLA